MQEKHLFEYAVIRVVPQVEREEFINVGVILYCSKLNFLDAKWMLDEKLMAQFAPKLDLDELKQNLCAFDIISKGGPEGGTIGMMDMPGRFRWLTATRSTILQPSSVHPGFTDDAEEMLERLYEQLVVRGNQ
ncbi:MAG: DUF3037 domain-containing protein [Saprospiraceae bacterium]|uniref:DUF3037 domain-containing protein n=1 Tax=Candidatus Opimibacter skivensis TaxID=2982028 RepID=A0A9D7SVK2_9BACT|nr:DUF3037 domain-containing protein [Candidatus Opimibacter skivensis]